MTECPKVSVVMSVYNGGVHVAPSVECILQQSFKDFEFIIVDDGSSDDSLAVLKRLAERDSRVQVVTQANQGLTAALVTGCERARGEYIARQDVGDRSLRHRFQKQVELLEAESEVVAVGGGCRRIGPLDEFLGETCRQLSPREVTQRLLDDGAGLSHAVAMFRREAYERIGGYRKPFRFAQDADLWYRLSRIGLLAEVHDVLFDLRVDVDGISASSGARQRVLAALARESYEVTGRGESDQAILDRAREASWGELPGGSFVPRHFERAAAEHFIGSQLYAHGDRRCRAYLMRAIRHRPLWLRPWAKLALSLSNIKIGPREST